MTQRKLITPSEVSGKWECSEVQELVCSRPCWVVLVSRRSASGLWLSLLRHMWRLFPSSEGSFWAPRSLCRHKEVYKVLLGKETTFSIYWLRRALVVYSIYCIYHWHSLFILVLPGTLHCSCHWIIVSAMLPSYILLDNRHIHPSSRIFWEAVEIIFFSYS